MKTTDLQHQGRFLQTETGHGPGGRTHRWLAFAVALATPLLSQAQLSYFPIATQGAVMSVSFDGSTYLCGVETPGAVHAVGAQRLSATGAKLGALITTDRTGIASGVAFDGSNFLLIWEDDELGALTNETYRVYGQFISPAGTLVGAPFDISGLGVQFDGIKAVAFGGGKYLVTYTRWVQLGGSWSRHIAGRLVDPSGSVGSEFRVSSGVGKASDVVFGGSQFFVVWCEDGLDREIRGRFVSPTGGPGLEVSVNASAAPSDNPNSVGFDGTNFLVVWNDENDGATSWDAYGQLVSPAGALVGGPIVLAAEPGPQMVVSVASDGRRFLPVWVDMEQEANWNVYGRYVGSDGSLEGDRLTLGAGPSSEMGGVGYADGKYLVLINRGMQMGEHGIVSVEGAEAAFLTPPADPQVETGDADFGVRDNQFGFSLSGSDGAVLVVEACTDLTLANWTPVSTNTVMGGTSHFSDAGWMNHTGRFYRLRSP